MLQESITGGRQSTGPFAL
jgi:hypothetical protein